MKLFLWEFVSQLTGSYHDGGGVVVIAQTLDDARELLKSRVPKGCDVFDNDPDLTVDILEPRDQEVYIFPDAGCC